MLFWWWAGNLLETTISGIMVPSELYLRAARPSFVGSEDEMQSCTPQVVSHLPTHLTSHSSVLSKLTMKSAHEK